MEFNRTNINYNQLNKLCNKSKSCNDFKNKKKLTAVDIDIVNKNINKNIEIPGFNTNIKVSKVNQMEYNYKTANIYDREQSYKLFGIDYKDEFDKCLHYYKDNQILEMNNEIMDELLNEIGNHNYGKRTLRLKNPKDNLNEHSSIEKFSDNFILFGYNKNNVERHFEVSYNKNDKNYIGNFTHITYYLSSKGYVDGQYDLMNSLENNGLTNEIKQKCFNFMSKAINETYARKIISTNNIEVIKNVLRKKYRINTRYSKIATIDCDFNNTLEGSIKKRFIFYILRFFKYVIIENKNIYKKNHFTIVIFLINFYDMKFITTIRNLFKIAGICDKGHSTVFGKNIFDTDEYNIYYNKNGKYLDENLNEFYNGIIGKCFDANTLLFKNLGIDINKTINIEDEDYIKADSLLSINRQQNAINLIDFGMSNEFVDFAESNGLTFEPKKKEKIVLELNKNEEYNNTSIGLDKFKEDFNNGKITCIEDLFNYNIILKGDYRKKNTAYIGFKFGRLNKFNTLKEAIEVFNKIVTIDGEFKQEEIENKFAEGYIQSFSFKKYHYDENGKMYEEYQIYLGNISHNSRRCMKIMKNIVIDMLKLLDKKTDKEIESFINKKHRTYKPFIKNAIKIIRNSSINELNNNLKECMKKFLYSHILSYGFENFKLKTDDYCCYALNVDNEFNNFYVTNIEKKINKFIQPNIEKEQSKVLYNVNQALNILKKVVCGNTFTPLRI